MTNVKEIAKLRSSALFSPDKYLALMKWDWFGRGFHWLLRIYQKLASGPYRFLGIEQGRATDTVVIAWLMLLTLGFGIGGQISKKYIAMGYDLLSIFDIREVITFIFSQFIVNTYLWAVAVWQIKTLPKIFRQLLDHSVVKSTKPQALMQFTKESLRVFQSGANVLIALTISILGVYVMWTPLFGSKENPFLFGHEYHWAIVSETYLQGIFFPFTFLTIYFLSLVVLRIFGFAIVLSKFYTLFQIRPVLFHPDGASGFGFIGRQAAWIFVLALLFGLLVPFFIYFPAILGGEPHVATDLIAMLIAYVTLLPIIFFGLLWSTHIELQKYKQKELLNTAQKIKSGLMSSKLTETELSKLEKELELKERGYASWPFRLRSFGGASLPAILPIASSIVPIVSDLLTLMTVKPE